MVDDDLVAERDALKNELAEIQRKIEIAERAPVDKTVLLAAIDQAQRDRDALTSPALEDLREQVDNRSDAIESCWSAAVGTLSRCNIIATRFQAIPIPDRLIPAITDLTQARTAAMARLEAADIDYVRIAELPTTEAVFALQRKQADGAG